MSGIGILFNAPPEFLAFRRIGISLIRYCQFPFPSFNDFPWNRIEEPISYELQRLVFNMGQITARMPNRFG